MSSTLLQVRTKVRSFIDEPTAIRWTDAELNTFINSSVEQVNNDLTTSGSNQFYQTSSVNCVSGTIDISSLGVLKILNLSMNLGGVLLQVYPVRPKDVFLTQIGYSGVFSLTYVAKVTSLSSDSSTVFFGNNIVSNQALDELVAVLAARKALIKDNEVRPGLESLKDELMKQCRGFADNPQWYVMPAPTWPSINRASFNWALLNPGTIQLSLRT